MRKLSIIIPTFNEQKTILEILNKIKNSNIKLDKEVLIIDDGSTDNTQDLVQDYIKRSKTKNDKYIYYKKKNQGKGSAVRKGFEMATGEIITIQDADLEYNPNDFAKLIQPIINGESKVVYGSRFLYRHEPMYKIYYLGNKFLSLLTRIMYGANITDMETCYKVFEKITVKSILPKLKSNKFNIEPEITARLLKQKIKIIELPISYNPRSIQEGKKIGWRDGLQAIYTLIKLKIVS